MSHVVTKRCIQRLIILLLFFQLRNVAFHVVIGVASITILGRFRHDLEGTTSTVSDNYR